MDNKYEIEIVINEELSEENLNIIKRYWFLDNDKFIETPSKIGKAFGLSGFEVSKIAKKFTYLKITRNCSDCESIKELKANTITIAKEYLKSSWICNNCIKQNEQAESERLAHEQKLILENRANKFARAISEQSWYKLNRKDLKLLSQMLQAPSTQILIKRLIELKEKKYWSILYRADEYGLVDLVKNNKNYIIEHYPLHNLEDHIKPYLNPSINTQTTTKKTHSKLSFRMLKNKYRNSSDDPLNNGTFIPEEDIILMAGVPHSYLLYPRENGDVHVSIIPIDQIGRYKNYPRSGGPKPIGDVIDEWND